MSRNKELETYLRFVCTTARKAGKLLTRLSRRKRPIRIGFKKTRFNLVTEADRTSERFIIKTIKAKYPRHGIISEEGGGMTGRNQDFKWIIDPLDGTTNYAHQFPCYCVSIALESRLFGDPPTRQGVGEIVVGVIYNPNLDELFWACKGRPAYLNHRRIRVSKTNQLSSSLLATGFPYNIRRDPGDNFHKFKRFSLSARAVRRAGSAALDLAYLAAGRFDGFWERGLHTWDVAAGYLIVNQAGGKITDFKGNRFDIYQPRETLASNARIHPEMIKVLKSL